jgi:VanZ family protein
MKQDLPAITGWDKFIRLLLKRFEFIIYFLFLQNICPTFDEKSQGFSGIEASIVTLIINLLTKVIPSRKECQ